MQDLVVDAIVADATGSRLIRLVGMFMIGVDPSRLLGNGRDRCWWEQGERQRRPGPVHPRRVRVI